MKCPMCNQVAVTDYYRPELAWCHCGWASPAMHGPDLWDIKFATIEAECNRNKILRGGPVLRAMLAMAEQTDQRLLAGQ